MTKGKFINVLLFILIILISYSCITNSSVFELEKSNIINNYILPDALNGKIYKYEIKYKNNLIKYIYLSYEFRLNDNGKLTEVNTYDGNKKIVNHQKILRNNDSIKVTEYINYTQIGKGKLIENKARITRADNFNQEIETNEINMEKAKTNKLKYIRRIIDCEKSKYTYKNKEYDTFLISYKDEIVVNDVSIIVINKIQYAKDLGDVYTIYIRENKMDGESKLIEIIDYNDFILSTSP